MLLDAWRLALGTLSALPTRPPGVVDRRRAGIAMVLAPLAVLPLGLAVAAVVVVGDLTGLSPLPVALLALGAAVLGTRGFHLDGLSDVADGLAASYDRQRSLEVMKTGTSGPAGGVALFLVLGLQTAGLAGVVAGPETWRAAALAGVAVCVSRAALVVCCVRGVGPARADGLGRIYTQTVAPAVATGVWVAVAFVLALVAAWAGLDWWRGVLATGLALAVVVAVVARSVSRFGGVTGDVFGASIELALASLLVGLS